MRVTLVTGSRADRGALDAVGLELARRFHETVWVDVSPPLGPVSSYDAVETAAAAMRTVGLGLMTREPPDWVVVHGDRYEILSAAVAARMSGAAICHLGGGDVTAGSQDDAWRDAISVLSGLHCVSHVGAHYRLVNELGIAGERVLITGDPEIDLLGAFVPIERARLKELTGLRPETDNGKVVLGLLHPNTLDADAAVTEITSMHNALAACGHALVLVGPNADVGGRFVRSSWRDLADRRPDTVYFDAMPRDLFLSWLRHADVLVGNSSAGIIEAPVLGTPVVNVGNRQAGRPRARCIIDVAPNADAILAGIKMALTGRHEPESLFGDGRSAARVVAALEELGR